MSAPKGSMGDSRTRVLLAVVNHWHPTVRGIARDTGIPFTTVHDLLTELRAEGLVDWVDSGRGTLHATVEEIPIVVRPFDYDEGDKTSATGRRSNVPGGGHQPRGGR